jgi:serine/threonine-protein kinase HipA
MSAPTSSSRPERAFVWAWLPGARAPIVAGVISPAGNDLNFRYGDSYLSNPHAISLYAPVLPLETRVFSPVEDLGVPGPLRDCAPDAWGRRVILNRLTGERGRNADVTHLSELTYLLNSGSNRLGGIDFQRSATDYIPREDGASLDDLHRAADMVEAGEPLPQQLGDALQDGTAIGGARPKALLRATDDRQYIAKFSLSTDTFSVVGAEAASMALARAVGIPVAPSKVVQSRGKEVLLMERFDRTIGGGRRMVVSALTMLGLGEMTSRYGTYPALLDVLRTLSRHPESVGEELFRRIAFNIAISNTDDHLRNHAAFWDGQQLELTPAYDLSPTARSGDSAAQVLAFGRDGEKTSNFALLTSVAHVYGLSKPRANDIIDALVSAIRDTWAQASEEARLTVVDRQFLWERQFLNPAAFFPTTQL